MGGKVAAEQKNTIGSYIKKTKHTEGIEITFNLSSVGDIRMPPQKLTMLAFLTFIYLQHNISEGNVVLLTLRVLDLSDSNS